MSLYSESIHLLRLAGPIMIAQLATTAMGFVDAYMAGQLSANDLAYVALGNSIWVPTLLTLGAILTAVTTHVARVFGDKQTQHIPLWVQQGMILALIMSLAISLMMTQSNVVLTWFEVDPPLIAPTQNYLNGIAMGLPAILVFMVLRNASEAMNHPWPGLVISLMGLVLNAPLNSIFMHGHFGVTAMGGVGCGYATGLIWIIQLVAMLMWIRFDRHYRNIPWRFIHFRLSFPVLKKLLRLGLPMGGATMAEVSIFSVIALLVGRMGSVVVAGHQIALTISALIFMIPYSLGIAASIQTSARLGAHQKMAALETVKTVRRVSVGFALITASLIVLFSKDIASLFSNDQAVIDLASYLLLFAALYQVPDALQVTSAGCLRGYHDTVHAMWITLASYWLLGLPLGYTLAYYDNPFGLNGPAGFWVGLVVGLSVAALFLYTRLKKITMN